MKTTVLSVGCRVSKEMYPGDLPKNRIFDAVLFAGCNLLQWLFYDNYEVGMERLSHILDKNGIVIFVEGQGYIKNVVTKGRSFGLSIPLDEMKLVGATKDDEYGLKQEILKSWAKFFKLTRVEDYFAYIKKKNSENKIQ